MASTPEGRVKKEIAALLKRYDLYYHMPVTGGYGHSGVLDYSACQPITIPASAVGQRLGRYLGIEAKSVKTRHGVTALQQRTIDNIQAAGGLALVVNEDNLDELERILRGN